MRERKRVSLIAEQLDGDEARSAIAAAAPVSVAMVEGKVFYPYHWYRVSGSAPGLLGRRPVSLSCLVDACSGIASTADRFALERQTLPDGVHVVPHRETLDAAGAARRYASHALGRGLRTIADFGLDLEQRGIVYKSFWVIGCGTGRLLVDSVSGAFHPLQV